MTLPPLTMLFELPVHPRAHGRELIIDSFAGGGGASTGIEMALGRSPDYAINHDAEALALHAANHPATVHLSRNIWQIDPLDVVGNRPVGLAWFSPDCKHFSKAKGGKPVSRGVRDLAWVVVLWAKRIRPRVIMLENVEEFREWGPLTADGKPCVARRGQTFTAWVGELRRLGYRVEHRELRACDYGAPTIRKRLFMIARRDGRPIVWPAPTHGAPTDPQVIAGRKAPWRTAAEIIDWSLPCPSIFDSAAQIWARHGLRAIRPLADNTLRRIARGVMRYVVDAPRPFLISVAHGDSGGRREFPLDQPIGTQTSGGGSHALVVPFMTYAQQGGAVRDAQDPLHTITASRKDQNALVVAAFLAQHNSGVIGHDMREPVSTLTAKAGPQALVAAHMVTLRGTNRSDAAIEAPIGTVSAGGNHTALIAAFLCKYYGAGDLSQPIDDPLHSVTTKPHHGLVTVEIDGTSYAIVDIGMRMLTPRERFQAQGFADTYQIAVGRGPDGAPVPLTLDAQGRMCGNSVCPPVAQALVIANVPELATSAVAA